MRQLAALLLIASLLTSCKTYLEKVYLEVSATRLDLIRLRARVVNLLNA